MVTKFAGKRYKLVSSENFEAYLKAIEASDEIINLVKDVKPVLELVIEGDTYILKSSSPNRTLETKFKLGQEFEQALIDGRKVPTTIVAEGDKLIETHRAHKVSKVVREFSNDGVKITSTVDNVTAIRIYKAE